MNLFPILTAIALALSCTSTLAERITDPQAVLKAEHCVGGGTYLWDSKKCLFENDTLLLDGKVIALREVRRVRVSANIRDPDSVGYRERVEYIGTGVKVEVVLRLLRGGCDYADEKCTYRNYFADFKVTTQGKGSLLYQGVGYSGS